MDWIERAACRGYDIAAFFPMDSGNYRDSTRAICEACPVRDACLDHALRHESFGMWAGTTPTERAKMRAERGIPSPLANGIVA